MSKHEIRTSYVICGECGKRTHAYNPRVGMHRRNRICEHKNTEQMKCTASNTIIDYSETGNAIKLD